MATSDKKVRELELKLKDKNVAIVVTAIESLRNHDHFSGAIRLLADLYDSAEVQIIKDHIRNFMNDLKESSARTEVMAEITGSHDQDTVTMLVSSCWQSGLDYSEWISDFAIVFCNADYPAALECFTVIEEASQNLPVQKKKELISILKVNEDRKRMEKSSLQKELISVLS